MTTKDETETIVTWTANDERATVYSLMPRIWRQCLQAGGEEINLSEGIRNGKKLARTFLVPAKAVKIRKARSMTPAQVKASQERGRALAARQMGLDRPTQADIDPNQPRTTVPEEGKE